MGATIKLGNIAVAKEVVALYAHYLPDVVASVLAQDVEEKFAVDATFESILPAPYRLVVYRRFVSVYSRQQDSTVSDAFFQTREEVVPTSVVEGFRNSLPADHYLQRHFDEDGFYGRIRDRLLDALQYGGMKPLDQSRRFLRFLWLATGAEVTIRFDPNSKLLKVAKLRVGAPG